jgi:general stress protein 26
MKMSEEIKGLVEKAVFIPLVTQGKEGPHLVVMGKGFVMDDETISFFGWRQSNTSQNIKNNRGIQIALVSEKKNSGFRLAGSAHIETEGKIYDFLKERFPAQLGNLSFATVMKVEKVEPLL